MDTIKFLYEHILNMQDVCDDSIYIFIARQTWFEKYLALSFK